MAVKKLSKKSSAPVPEKQVGKIEKKEKPRSPHADTKFITGTLGLALADAHDETVEALKKAGFKPYKNPVSTQPFTTDRNRRKSLAAFVDNDTHREIIMPPAGFKSQFGKKAERKPMDDETKALLREKKNAKASLRPKRAEGGVSIQDLCKELGIEPRDARKALRKAKIAKPDCGWYWKLREEAVAIMQEAGLMDKDGKKAAPADKPGKRVGAVGNIPRSAKALDKKATDPAALAKVEALNELNKAMHKKDARTTEAKFKMPAVKPFVKKEVKKAKKKAKKKK